jgi:hypothetical protein
MSTGESRKGGAGDEDKCNLELQIQKGHVDALFEYFGQESNENVGKLLILLGTFRKEFRELLSQPKLHTINVIESLKTMFPKKYGLKLQDGVQGTYVFSYDLPEIDMASEFGYQVKVPDAAKRLNEEIMRLEVAIDSKAKQIEVNYTTVEADYEGAHEEIEVNVDWNTWELLHVKWRLNHKSKATIPSEVVERIQDQVIEILQVFEEDLDKIVAAYTKQEAAQGAQAQPGGSLHHKKIPKTIRRKYSIPANMPPAKAIAHMCDKYNKKELAKMANMSENTNLSKQKLVQRLLFV